MTLLDLVHEVARYGLTVQDASGSMPPGHNGPYRDRETPLRATAHWGMIFCRAWEMFGDDAFLDAARSVSEYMVGPTAQIGNESCHCRTNPKKDASNGLIGPAWVIEALTTLGTCLDRADCIEVASTLASKPQFSPRAARWENRPQPDGQSLSADTTFNHQLWFAMASAMVARQKKNDDLLRKSHLFLSALPKHAHVYGNGHLFHPMNTARARLVRGAKDALKSGHSRYMRSKEIGYQSFNILAMARLGHYLDRAHDVEPTIRQMIRIYDLEASLQLLSSSCYSYSYNVPEWELLAASSFVSLIRPVAVRLYQRNHHRIPVIQEFALGRDVIYVDRETEIARVYELSLCQPKLLQSLQI